MYSLSRFSLTNSLQALVSLGIRGYILQLRESGADRSRLMAWSSLQAGGKWVKSEKTMKCHSYSGGIVCFTVVVVAMISGSGGGDRGGVG